MGILNRTMVNERLAGSAILAKKFTSNGKSACKLGAINTTLGPEGFCRIKQAFFVHSLNYVVYDTSNSRYAFLVNSFYQTDAQPYVIKSRVRYRTTFNVRCFNILSAPSRCLQLTSWRKYRIEVKLRLAPIGPTSIHRFCWYWLGKWKIIGTPIQPP